MSSLESQTRVVSTLPKITYRPEIDGLRAIAILGVVFYHADFGPISGFLGVDVFFVISGYLITSLLQKEWLETGDINFFNFYARRFRRLYAALVCVIAVTVVASGVLLSPFDEIRNVAESASAAFLLSANIYFDLTTGGYFDVESNTLPLLHLWSIAVEEQFYLVWPLIFLAINSWGGNIKVILALLLVVSLVASEVMLIFTQDSAYYQTPSRFWELATGGVIALMPNTTSPSKAPVGVIGFILVLAAMLVPLSHFPGIGAVPVVLGTALIIYSIHINQPLGLVGKALGSRPMVFTGLISYSLYLWHWPLLALDNSLRFGEPHIEERLLIVVGAFFLAFLTYRYVERPFRYADKSVSSQRLVLVGSGTLVVMSYLVFQTGIVLHKEKPAVDLATRTSRDMPSNRYTCHYRGEEPIDDFPRSECINGNNLPVKIAIWGDSMALAWQPFAVVRSHLTNVGSVSYSRDACPPVLGFSNGKFTQHEQFCKDFNNQVIKRLDGIETLVLASTWTPVQGGSKTHFLEYEHELKQTIESVSPNVDEILLLGPSPRMKERVPKCIQLKRIDDCAITRKEFEASSTAAIEMLKRLASEFGRVTFIDVSGFFCESDTCPALKDGYGLYWDSHHVSSTAAQNFANHYYGSDRN